jgi:hypothetical protein
MWMDMEMTKKQMEERIAQLEKMVMELQSQLLALALRTPNTITITAPQPINVPISPVYTYPPVPHIDDWPYGTNTCTT